MLKIGIRAHDVGKDSIENLAKKVHEAGFKYIQLVLSKAIIDDDGLLTKEKAIYYKQVFDKYDIKVTMLGAYFNPIHSNLEKVKAGTEKFKNHLTFAKYLECKYVGSETGSYNDDKWTYHIDNHTEKAFEKVYETFKDLTAFSENTETNVAIEGAFNHTIGTPARLDTLLTKINSDHVYAIVDLYNYLNYDNYQDQDEIFMEAIRLLKDKIVLFHLKDYIVDEENKKLIQVGLGKGLINFKKIMSIIKENVPDAYLIFEGVTGNDIKSSKDLIEKLICEE